MLTAVIKIFSLYFMQKMLCLVSTLFLIGAGCTQPPAVLPVPLPVPTVTPTTTTITTPIATTTSMQLKKQALIQVNGIPDRSVIHSPLVLTGQARGNWYFEASFPVEVHNASNTLMGQGVAQAQSDWMTTNFVPFAVTLTFSAPSGTSGFLLLKKDNPSGEPANDDQLLIPVTF